MHYLSTVVDQLNFILCLFSSLIPLRSRGSLYKLLYVVQLIHNIAGQLHYRNCCSLFLFDHLKDTQLTNEVIPA